MLRLLLESNAKGFQFRQGAFVSVVTHSALIAAAVYTTGQEPSPALKEAQQSVTFLIPLNRAPTLPPKQEAVHFVKEGQQAGSGGIEDKPVEKKAPVEAPVKGTTGPEEGKPEQVSEESDPMTAFDTVATAVDVDSMVTRYPDSAAPAYPQKLLELKVEGGAYVQFVVDTTGLADVESFRVISSTHPEFAESVKEALPRMRFHPAILRSKKVRQLVEQPFMFKIVAPTPAAQTAAQKP